MVGHAGRLPCTGNAVTGCMPTFHTIVLTSAAVLSVSLASACARNPGGEFNQGEVRPATGLPSEFALPAALAATAPVTLSSCISPLIDQRTGAEIRLVRSRSGRGDYEIPAGQYGARAEELLRVDCARRTAIGLVRR